MPFECIHPSQFVEKFGLKKVPCKATLKRWRDQSGFPGMLEIPRGHFRLAEVEQWFASRRQKKPCTFVIQPDRQRILKCEAPVRSVEALQGLLTSSPGEQLECIPLSDNGDTLVRRTRAHECCDEGSAYLVAGHRCIGKSLIGVRPKDADPIPVHLVGDTQIQSTSFTPDDVEAMLEWSAEVAGAAIDAANDSQAVAGQSA